jgi:hypothetical protein
MACYSFCVRKETTIILVESLIDHSLFLRVKLYFKSKEICSVS